MADPRHHTALPARRWYRSPVASWAAWFVTIACAALGWAVTTFDAAGTPSPTTLPVLWVSPAALVILAVWWNGARGAVVSVAAVVVGVGLRVATADAAPFDALQWVSLALAAVAGPILAAAGLRRAHADLRRPGLFDTGRFVAVVVVAAVGSALATVGLLALWGHTPPDVLAAVRALAVNDLSASVVVVPVAFLTRSAGGRRRARPAPLRRRPLRLTRVGLHTGVLLAIVALVLAISNGGTRVDVFIGASLALALAALLEERRRSESATRRALGDLALDRARFRSLVDDSPEGVLVLDALGHIESVNRGASEIFGRSPDELVGCSLLDLVPAPAGADPATHLVEVLGSGTTTSGFGPQLRAFDAVTSDGRVFALDFAVSRVEVGGNWGYIATVRDGRDRRRRDQVSSRRATHDPLTDLPNGVLFHDRLEQSLAALRDRPDGLALLLVVLDRTQIDRELGSLTGDALLAQAARRVLQLAAPSDTVARLADDQIVLCRSGLHPGDVETLATELVASLALPYEDVPEGTQLGTRVGIVTTEDPEAEPDRLLRAVDAAVARVSPFDDRRWCIFDPAHDESTIDLRDPITDDRVVLRYQPMLDLATGHVTSMEAVVQIRCDNGTLIGPDEHRSLWERAGVRDRLAAIVLPRALGDLVSLREEIGSERLRVAVDISPAELTGALVDIVRTALERLELPADALWIEVTEAAPLDTMADELAVLRELRELGVRIVLDDFGTGFTRLDLIPDLPVDAVKIDRSFVGRMVESSVDNDIVETIVSVARRRDLTVIADGVESVDQVDALTRLGCGQAQGRLFGRPVDAEALRYLLREWQIVPAIATALIRAR